MKKILPLIVLIALALAAGLYFYPRWKTPEPAANTLLISGNIEAQESEVGFKIPGRIATLPVQEGQCVREGDLLASLDGQDYRQQVRIDEAGLQAREAELKLALAGSRTQEIKAAEQAMLDAQADLELKKTDLQRFQALYEKDAVSAQTRDTAATHLKRAQAAYEGRRQVYDQLREGARKEQIAINQANVQLARQNLEQSRLRQGDTLLRAPRPGVITVRQAELGEVVAPGGPVVTIADLDHVWLRGYISETDLGRVRWGQPAKVRTDTFPEKTYGGRVSFIASQAEFTPKSVETHKERVTLVYRIKIDLDNPNRELKPGMPADAEIELTGL